MQKRRTTLAEARPLDDKELKDVYMMYKDALYGYVLSRVKNTHDAEDLFSKSVMKFCDYAGKKNIKQETLKSLLFTIACNTMNDFFRRKKIIRFVSLDSFVDPGEKETYHEFFTDARAQEAFGNIDKKTILDRVNRAMHDLPEEQKEAFFLRFIEGLSFQDIAGIQSTGISTALSRVRYAVEKIKEHLAREGVLKTS
jgi:RNA polymerase sigma-70 factor, ECF subfamily